MNEFGIPLSIETTNTTFEILTKNNIAKSEYRDENKIMLRVSSFSGVVK